MGFMAGCPIAGVVWQHLHYIVGLQRLGHDVYYIEDSARYPYNPVTFASDTDFTYAAETLDRLGREYGFSDRWCYCARFHAPPQTAGLSFARMRELYREADAILNVCGSQEFNEDLLQSERILYVESDPGVEQIKIDKGDDSTREYLERHRGLFTFGENVGSEKFPVPTHGMKWIATRQPIVTDFWKAPPPAGEAAVYTSIANWNTSGKKDIEWQGERYLWSKSLEFLRFVEAPRVAGETMELATSIPDAKVVEQFRAQGWRLTDPNPLSVDHDLYRSYIWNSKGEFTAAKDQYVRLKTGWFSDRSACYLAAERPVITQETGFSELYGSGRGLIGFQSLEEIAEAARAIRQDYAAHARAAYEIAAEHFEATKVLARLLSDAGV